jgi:hypothetical protein
MSFIAKPDYYGLAAQYASGLKLKSSAQNASSSRAIAQNHVGDVIASVEFGETSAPTCEYIAENGLEGFNPVLGSIATAGGKHYVLTSVTIKKSLGQAVNIQCAGQELPADVALGSCTCPMGAFNLPAGLHAEILKNAFSFASGGLNTLKEYTIAFQCDFYSETVDGVIVAWDIGNPRMTVAATIQQAGSAPPSLTDGDGWRCNAPLSTTNADAEYPSWSVGYIRDLAVIQQS